MKNNRGFSLYLTFLVTTVIFILVSGSYEISRISLDMGRSSAIDVILFHAADGGLERGLAKLRKEFTPCSFSYKSSLGSHRIVEVKIQAITDTQGITLNSIATLFEGKNQVSTRHLIRKGIINTSGRTGTGKFMEAS